MQQFNESGSPLDRAIAKYERILIECRGRVNSWRTHKNERWAATGALLFIFGVRIAIVKGWYIIAYTLGIYLLQNILAYVTPKYDLEAENDMELEDGGNSRAKDDGEVVPFYPSKPEFDVWKHSTLAIIASIVGSFFVFLDWPVFWPILVVYWLVLVFITMKQRIAHMMKFGYVPWSKKTKPAGYTKSKVSRI